MEILVKSPTALHREVHPHACPIHARGKCGHVPNDPCPNCTFQESNEVCGKNLRGTGLEYHIFPCMNCAIHWRNSWGAETMIDGLINLEQAARLAHEAPSAKVEAREEREAAENPDVKEFVNERKRI